MSRPRQIPVADVYASTQFRDKVKNMEHLSLPDKCKLHGIVVKDKYLEDIVKLVGMIRIHTLNGTGKRNILHIHQPDGTFILIDEPSLAKTISVNRLLLFEILKKIDRKYHWNGCKNHPTSEYALNLYMKCRLYEKLLNETTAELILIGKETTPVVDETSEPVGEVLHINNNDAVLVDMEKVENERKDSELTKILGDIRDGQIESNKKQNLILDYIKETKCEPKKKRTYLGRLISSLLN